MTRTLEHVNISTYDHSNNKCSFFTTYLTFLEEKISTKWNMKPTQCNTYNYIACDY